MNALPLETPRWSRRCWAYTVAFVFAMQVALVVFLGERPRALPPRPALPGVVRFAADARSAQQMAMLPGLSDPTLLALPNLDGFSGAAWLRFTPLDYQPAGWSEPPRWLALGPEMLGRTFARLIATNQPPPLVIADQPLPPLPRSEPNFPNDPLPSFSRLHLEGGLAQRQLAVPIELKPWPHSDLLSNTTVRAMVSAEGFTLSTLLQNGCGLREADDLALTLAAAARFQPLPRNEGVARRDLPPTWGSLVFHWHTLPLVATNLASGQP